MMKSIEIQSFGAEEGKSRTRKEDVVETLQKFARVAKLSTTFDFFLISFCFLPNFSLCNSVYFVQFGNLY